MVVLKGMMTLSVIISCINSFSPPKLVGHIFHDVSLLPAIRFGCDQCISKACIVVTFRHTKARDLQFSISRKQELEYVLLSMKKAQLV